MRVDGGDERGVRLELVPGDEARGPQHPQRIVGEADLRPERRAEHRVARSIGPAERIDELGHRRAGELERHRVDREVAPREIGLDVVGEHDVRLARVVGVRLGPERRDLVDLRVARPVSRWAPIVPNLSPWVQIESAHPSRQRLISAGRASVVRSMS